MAGPGKPGKPAWELTPEILDKIREQAQMGITEANIARNVGLHPSTFSEKKQQYPEIAEALKVGSAYGEHLATSALWKAISDSSSKGHMTAVLFYLKCKHNWNDGSKATVEVQAPTGVKFDVIPKGSTIVEKEE